MNTRPDSVNSGPRRGPYRTVAARGAFALALALAWPALAGCGAHLPLLRRGTGAPATPRAASRGPAAVRPSARGADESRGPGAPYRLAEHHVTVDSLALANAELHESLARDPDFAPALALLSKLYFEAGRHREAVAMLEPVRSRPEAFTPPARRALLAGLALHEDALGRADLAREALAAAHSGGGGEAGSADVFVTLRGDAPDSAEALAKDVLRRAGRTAVNLNNFGITRLRAGDPEAARRAFLGAIERDPALPGPYYNLAILDKFYAFDDTAAGRWFAQYWVRSTADPDSLRAVFSEGIASVPVPSGGRP